MNLSGRVIETLETNVLDNSVFTARIPDGLAAGAYSYRMIGDKEIKSGTFIVQ
jgi:hypothetical protein